MKTLFIDNKVYGSTQKFRIVKTSKINENRPLIPISFKKDLNKHFITNTDNLQEFIYINHEHKKEDFIKILDNIDISYSDNYNNWISIGSAIISLNMSNEDKLSIFNHFSKRSEKYLGLKDVKDKFDVLLKNL
jgi:hypothetical protein